MIRRNLCVVNLTGLIISACRQVYPSVSQRNTHSLVLPSSRWVFSGKLVQTPITIDIIFVYGFQLTSSAALAREERSLPLDCKLQSAVESQDWMWEPLHSLDQPAQEKTEFWREETLCGLRMNMRRNVLSDLGQRLRI